jgi:hypothetical protein
MTKRTSPLPAIDRRSLVCGLGTATVAGVPALADTASKSNDPVFQAIAALEQLKIHAEEQEATYEIAEAAVFRARGENGMTLDGEEMRTHEQIDAHFMPAFGPDDEEQFNRFVERLRPRRLSDGERAARQAAHDELALKEAKNAEVERRVGYHEINEQNDSAYDAVLVAQNEVMEAKPATPAGAISLLRFVTGLMEGLFPNDDEHEHYVGALRNAADFFERSASA